jgi:hypothetical protein
VLLKIPISARVLPKHKRCGPGYLPNHPVGSKRPVNGPMTGCLQHASMRSDLKPDGQSLRPREEPEKGKASYLVLLPRNNDLAWHRNRQGSFRPSALIVDTVRNWEQRALRQDEDWHCNTVDICQTVIAHYTGPTLTSLYTFRASTTLQVPPRCSTTTVKK